MQFFVFTDSKKQTPLRSRQATTRNEHSYVYEILRPITKLRFSLRFSELTKRQQNSIVRYDSEEKQTPLLCRQTTTRREHSYVYEILRPLTKRTKILSFYEPTKRQQKAICSLVLVTYGFQ